jgi:hypothetical protein
MNVLRRSDQDACRGQRFDRLQLIDLVLADLFRQTEVEHLHVAPGNHDVARLDVAMNHAFVVRGVERFGNLNADGRDVGGRKRRTARVRAQRLAGDQLHNQIRVAIGFADIVHGANVRVTEPGGGVGLALKALDRVSLHLVGRTLIATSRLSRVSRAR